MSRPKTAPGAIGSINVEQRKTGVRLRARMRDDAGNLHRIGATAATYEEAHAKLLEQARSIASDAGTALSGQSTVAELCEVWLEEVRDSRENMKTIEQYEAEVRTVVLPACGALTLDSLTVPRLDRIVRHVKNTRSLSAAKRLRKLLSMALGMAVRYGILPNNPMRDIQQLPGSRKKESYLTPQQFKKFCELANNWVSPNGRVRPDRGKLVDGASVIIGTSGRIGEVLALRRRDVDLSEYPGSVRIGATLQQTKGAGLVRKPTPKHARQTRVVTVPSVTRDALLRRLEKAGPAPDDYLFATKSGAPYSVSNFQRLMREFRDAHESELAEAGIDVEEFTTHVFRRTAATLVERYGGITLASRMLGHSDESITRANYVVTDEKVDPATAEILSRLFI